MRNILKSFPDFLALVIVIVLLATSAGLIFLPNNIQDKPIVTQYMSLASTTLSFIVGFYYGGMQKKPVDPNNPNVPPNPPQP